jgi:hypothetical protein
VSGNKVSTPVFALAALSIATAAGRVGENGTGAAWIAPELLRASTATPCTQHSRPQPVELRFERLDPDDIDSHAMPAESGRNAVSFHWNPSSSELTYRAGAASDVFSDLALPSAAPAAHPEHCG